MAEWIDLVDPTEEELAARVPFELHPRARDQLVAPADDDPRPRLEAHEGYAFGVFLIPVAVAAEDRIYYQELDFVLSEAAIVTVAKTPPGEQAFDTKPAQEACSPDDLAGMFAYHLADEIAERYLDLMDAINDEIDELEDRVDVWPADEVRRRISRLRHDALHIRRTLAPTRDAVHKVVDGRLELEAGRLFARDTLIHFSDVYDKLLRAADALELSRDLVGGVRDYAQAKIASDQNEVVKRLTAIASILLLPTFIVGLYGQNFLDTPEYGWGVWGYIWSWSWIVAVTVGQIVYFRRKGWL